VEDINPNAWGFSIDPKDPNRVWFLVRNSGTISGKPFLPDTLNFKPEKGGEVNGCPETFSIIFDDDEKVKYLSVGYVADRFEGNTYGKGKNICMNVRNLLNVYFTTFIDCAFPEKVRPLEY